MTVRLMVAGLLLVHGLIHLMGAAKAFGYASLPQLTQPITRGMGLVWLSAGLLVCLGAVMVLTSPRHWWIVGAVAIVVSQAAILTAWRDAWAGTLGNVVLLLAVVYGFLTEGPWSFHAQFDRDVADGLARPFVAAVVTENDVAESARTREAVSAPYRRGRPPQSAQLPASISWPYA